MVSKGSSTSYCGAWLPLGVHDCDHGFILPHEWFAFMYTAFKPIFFKVFMGVEASHAKRHLAKFWGMVKHDDPRRSSLQHDHESMHAFTIPGWIHGDGVPCTRYDSFEVCSWGSMLSKWIWFASGYFGKVRHVHANKKKDTKHVFVKILTWSFRALTIGKWPDKDWDDNPFPKDSPGDMKKGMWLADGPFSEHT